MDNKIDNGDYYNIQALNKALSLYNQEELASELMRKKHLNGDFDIQITVNGNPITTKGCLTENDFLEKYSDILTSAGILKREIKKESGVDAMEQQNNNVVVSDENRKIETLIQTIEGSNLFLDEKDKLKTDAIRKALLTNNDEDLTAAIEQANQISSTRNPMVGGQIASLLAARQQQVRKDNEYNNVVENAERKLNDRISAIGQGNFLKDADKPKFDAIVKAASTRSQEDLAFAIDKAIELQNSNVSYAEDIVSSLKTLMPVYTGKTYEEYNQEEQQMQQAELLRQQEEEQRQQAEYLAQQELEEERRKNIEAEVNAAREKEEKARKLNSTIAAAEAWNTFLDEKDKVKTDAIRKAIETNNENDIQLAMDQANAIKNSGNPNGEQLYQLLSEKQQEIVNQNSKQDTLDDVKGQLLSTLGAVDAANMFLDEKDKVKTDAIRKALETNDENDIALALQQAEVVKQNSSYGEKVSQLLNAYVNNEDTKVLTKTMEQPIVDNTNDLRLNDNVLMDTPIVEPAVETVVGTPVVEPVIEPVIETSAVEPAVETVVETPVVEPTVETVVETPVVEPVVEPTVDLDLGVDDSVAAPTIDTNLDLGVDDSVVAPTVDTDLDLGVDDSIAAPTIDTNLDLGVDDSVAAPTVDTNLDLGVDDSVAAPTIDTDLDLGVDDSVAAPTIDTNLDLGVDDSVAAPVVDTSIDIASLKSELERLNSDIDVCNKNLEKTGELKRIYKTQYESKKAKLLADINSAEDGKLKPFPSLYPMECQNTVWAYHVAAGIPTVDNIVDIYDKLSKIPDNEEHKQEILDATNRLVATHIKDQDELAEINNHINGLGFANVDQNNILKETGEDKKAELQQELNNLEDDYNNKNIEIDSIIKSNLKIKEDAQARKEEISAILDENHINALSNEQSDDFDFDVEDEDFDNTLDTLNFDIEDGIEVKDNNEDSLSNTVPVRSIKDIGKKLYEKITSIDFTKPLKKVGEFLLKHKVASVFIGTTFTVGALGFGSVISEMNEAKDNKEIETEASVSQDEINSEETIDNSKFVIDENVPTAEVESNEVVVEENKDDTLSFEEASKKAIEDAANGDAKVYATVTDAFQDVNGLDAYQPSWSEATPSDYYTYNEGTLTAVSNQEAQQIYDNGGNLVEIAQNEGEPIGAVSVHR